MIGLLASILDRLRRFECGSVRRHGADASAQLFHCGEARGQGLEMSRSYGGLSLLPPLRREIAIADDRTKVVFCSAA